MKKLLFRITAVITAICLLFTVESVLGVRIYSNTVYAAEDQTTDIATVSDSDVFMEEALAFLDVLEQQPGKYVYTSSNLDQVKQTSSVKEPVQAVADDHQMEFDDINTITEDIKKTTVTTSISQVIGKTTDSLDDLSKGFLKDRGNLIADAAAKEAEATVISKYFPDNYTPEKISDLLADSSDARAKAATYQKKAVTVDGISGVLKVASVGLDAYSIISDIEGLQNLQHEHSSLRALETTLLVADGTLAAVSILSTTGVIALGSLATPLLVAGVVVGLTSSFVHSEGFANYMNSMDGNVLDFFDNLIESMFPWMKTPDGVNCYKPNIYIYDSQGRRIDLIFSHPQLIIKSIPEYETGWTVTANENSHLLTPEGEEYTYLFYESVTVRGLFHTESGFMLSSEKRVEEWQNILSSYGFNETEINDFIAFWDEMLEDEKDYIMYPQYTETVDKAMELTITPVPENIVRMWFVFEEYQGQEYEVEEIVPFTREGYTVVEWGGMVF